MKCFINTFLTNMFRPLLRPSSGRRFYYKNTKVQMWLVHSGEKIVNQIHYKYCSVFCWFFVYYFSD